MQRSYYTAVLNSEIIKLHRKRKSLSTISLLFAMVGVGLMIWEIEIASRNFKNGIKTPSRNSIIIKVMVSISTLLLCFFIMLYHWVSILLYMAENCVQNWQLVLNSKRLMMIFLEIFICGIHPIPLNNNSYRWKTERDYQGKVEVEEVPINVVLTIIMFLRGYLILRVLVLHSYIYDSSMLISVDIIQKRNMNTNFALKYLLTVYSKYLLILSVVFLFAWTCWGVRVCEMYEKKNDLEFFTNLWFISVTFLTIGYGEVIPNTVCGRVVSLMAGSFGVVCTAYVVAIIAESMQLSYSETYLHQFIIMNDLDKRMKESAASIFQNVWLIKKMRRNQANFKSKQSFIQLKANLLKHSQKLKRLKNAKIQVEKQSLNIFSLYSGQMQIFHDINKLQYKMDKIESLSSKLAMSIEKKPSKV